MRRLIACLPLLLGQCLGASTPATLTPVIARPIAIESIPVPLDARDPTRIREGALRYIGGWQLISEARGFGGLSSVRIEGNRATLLSDAGAIVRFRIGRFGRMTDAAIAPIPRACAPGARKTDRDTESLTGDGLRWWIGLEWANSVCRTDATLTRADAVATPRSMHGWPRTGGPEAMLRLRNGSFLVFAEATRDGAALTPLLRFDRDPADRKAIATEYRYRAPDGYKPTDAAQMPDGRVLVLNRRFSLTGLFTAKLVMLDALGKAGEVVGADTIASFAPPLITENFEGVAVAVERGRTVIWLVSDDNYMRWQRTLLLKFALEETPKPPPSSRSRASNGVPSG